MRINISIPPDLPPGHRLRVQGLFRPLGAGPVPPGSQKTLTGTAEVSGRRSRPAAAPGLGGFLRQPFLRARFLSTHDEGGFLTGRFLKTGFLEGSPLRVLTLDEIRGFGIYDLSIKTVNQRGEESSGSAPLAIFLAPPPLGAQQQTLSSYDSGADVATFSLVHDSLRP